MKRIFTIVAALMMVASLSAQKPYTAYCSMSGGSYSQVDYGQESLVKNTLVDEDGRPIYFNSVVGMLNYMSKLGWEFVATLTTVESSDVFGEFEVSSSTKWLFKKEVTLPEEVTEGLMTRLLYQEGKR
jgi:hypothetical protein